MPEQTPDAIAWAMTQHYEGEPVTTDNASAMVDLVRQYFNTNKIVYSTFSYNDLLPLLGV